MPSKYDHMPLFDEQGNRYHRMTPAERAKIFIPFDPLKGFQEALREEERKAAEMDAALFSKEFIDEGEIHKSNTQV